MIVVYLIVGFLIAMILLGAATHSVWICLGVSLCIGAFALWKLYRMADKEVERVFEDDLTPKEGRKPYVKPTVEERKVTIQDNDREAS